MISKKVGILVIILAFCLAGFTAYTNNFQQKEITFIQNTTGTCFLDDGTCLHEKSATYSIIGFSIAVIMLVIGVFLIMFDKVQRTLLEHQKEVSFALKDAKKESEFDAYTKGFSEDEQKVLKVVKSQEGIQQSTLRFKTGLSKTSLSLILKDLEDRKVISRKESGKTNQVYLIKKF